MNRLRSPKATPGLLGVLTTFLVLFPNPVSSTEPGVYPGPLDWEVVMEPEFAWENGHLTCPFVQYDDDDGLYKMWYVFGSGESNPHPPLQGGGIGYAESMDGVDWTNRQRLITAGSRSEESRIYSPIVLKEDSEYRLYTSQRYIVVDGEWSDFVALRTGADGTSWGSWAAVLNDTGREPWEVYNFHGIEIFSDPAGGYRIFYSTAFAGFSSHDPKVYIATAYSSDGVNWSHRQQMLDSSGQPIKAWLPWWDFGFDLDGATYRWFFVDSEGNLRFATSSDGIHWTGTEDYDENRRRTIFDALANQPAWAGNQNILRTPDGREFIYFTADLPNGWAISRLELTTPLDVRISARIEPTEPRTLDDLECVTEIENDGGFDDLELSYHWFLDDEELTEELEIEGEVFPVTGSILSHYYTGANQKWSCVARVFNASGWREATTQSVTIRDSNEYALLFDGVDDYCEAQPTASFDIRRQITLEAWVNWKGKKFSMILNRDHIAYEFGISGSETNYGRFLWFLDKVETNAPDITLGWRDGGPVTENTWTHVALSYDGSKILTLINGEVIHQFTGSGSIASRSGPVTIGCRLKRGLPLDPPDSFFNGLIDEVRVWNVGRTVDEIREGMFGHLSGSEPNLVAYWNCDEGTGQVARDLSSYNNHTRLGTTDGPDDSDPTWVLSTGRIPLDVRISARIEPAEPRTLDDLECVTEIENDGGFDDLEFSYRWFVDGEELMEGLEVSQEFFSVTGPGLSHHFTSKGQTWSCLARVFNASGQREATTEEVTIQNTPPTAPVVKIIPENPRSEVGLAADIVELSFDPDGDEIGYEINWFRSQDGGETWAFKPELSGVAPEGVWVPPPFTINDDLWRVEVIPFEIESESKANDTNRIEGEAGEYRVYVGENSRPTILVDQPGSDDAPAFPKVLISWRAEDADGDPIRVDLYYTTDRTIENPMLIAENLPAVGTYWWAPDLVTDASPGMDFSGDQRITKDDFLILSQRWNADFEETSYRIYARAWDTKNVDGDASSPGSILVPEELPTDVNGLLQLIREWKE